MNFRTVGRAASIPIAASFVGLWYTDVVGLPGLASLLLGVCITPWLWSRNPSELSKLILAVCAGFYAVGFVMWASMVSFFHQPAADSFRQMVLEIGILCIVVSVCAVYGDLRRSLEDLEARLDKLTSRVIEAEVEVAQLTHRVAKLNGEQGRGNFDDVLRRLAQLEACEQRRQDFDEAMCTLASSGEAFPEFQPFVDLKRELDANYAKSWGYSSHKEGEGTTAQADAHS
jgi:uncharacterized protein YoxC